MPPVLISLTFRQVDFTERLNQKKLWVQKKSNRQSKKPRYLYEEHRIETNKQSNFKVSRGVDQKPEIKKVKVQASEKKEYKIKDYVVYPKHGVGQITEFKKISIGGIDVETYISNLKKIKLMEWFL